MLAFFTIQFLDAHWARGRICRSEVKRSVRDQTRSATDGQFVSQAQGPQREKRQKGLYELERGSSARASSHGRAASRRPAAVLDQGPRLPSGRPEEGLGRRRGGGWAEAPGQQCGDGEGGLRAVDVQVSYIGSASGNVESKKELANAPRRRTVCKYLSRDVRLERTGRAGYLRSGCGCKPGGRRLASESIARISG